MISARKNLLAMLLLVIIIAPSLLLFSRKIQQVIIKYEMQEKLEHARLQKLEIPVTSVHWYEKNKEIIVDGKLFDVKSYTTHGDNMVFLGLFDEEETQIKNQLTRLLQTQEEENKQNSLVTKFFSLSWYSESPNSLLNKLMLFNSTVLLPFYSEKIFSVFLSRSYPPPKG